MRPVFLFFFKLFGWKVSGEIDDNIKKAIFVVAPHWHNSDFFLGLATRSIVRRYIGFLGKAELFKPPFGIIFKMLGGTPVYRSKKSNLVNSQIEAINSKDECLVAITPEGTRKNVDTIKTGFYYVALGAEIPIILVGIDAVRKLIVIDKPFKPSGDFEKDAKAKIIPFYKGLEGKKKNWVNKLF